MNLAFWIALACFSVVSLLTLRVTVRFLARGADNGWDNALAYLLVSSLAIYFPIRWLLDTERWALLALAPLLLWIVQTVSLRAIYELTTLRAWLVGLAHTVATTLFTGTLAVIAGVIAAYILYGQIIADPVRILRLILQWLGIDLPWPVR